MTPYRPFHRPRRRGSPCHRAWLGTLGVSPGAPTAPSSGRWHVACAVGLSLIVGGIVSGCHRAGQPPLHGAGGGAIGAAGEPLAASPVVRGAESGLEMWWWAVGSSRERVIVHLPPTSADQRLDLAPDSAKAAVDDKANDPAEGAAERITRILDLPGEDYDAVLAPYAARPVPLSHEARARWARAGLRLIAVPIQDLPRVQARLRLVGPVQRQWMGIVPAWTDLATGPVTGPLSIVTGQPDADPFHRPAGPDDLDDSESAGVLRLPAGRLRLLVRCWLAPAPLDAMPDAMSGVASEGDSLPAALRLELAPQHVRGGAPRRPDAETRADRPVAGSAAAGVAPHDPGRGAASAGRILTGLLATMNVVSDDALLIVPASPAADWSVVPKKASRHRPEDGIADLHVPPTPTLGEAMLTSFLAPATGGASPGVPAGGAGAAAEGWGWDGAEPTTRIILVLIPRWPDPPTPRPKSGGLGGRPAAFRLED